jgi:metal-responsive CopG/Arc/MetJ family transcriptional regulator
VKDEAKAAAERRMKGINLELSAELLDEIDAACSPGKIFRRSAVLETIKRDLTSYLRTSWRGKVERRAIELNTQKPSE